MKRLGQLWRSQTPPCQGLLLPPCALLLHRDPSTLAQSVNVPRWFSAFGFSHAVLSSGNAVLLSSCFSVSTNLSTFTFHF